ncbi:peptidylprolyl isomerase [Vibrio tapetis]|uniref:Periplasmic chaperone PpiD n=1 Tax=Vibrio tapetis subsp. tapetis TaxID=1671868 RepID=A0A2N8ZDJ9_9VIBR|nr:peptidylprolyl isomerase [Vibrio tapetis]SON49974.1 Peptidyl-prolyl cis-trans isomerse D [Vibrio tapetis subsp. tapetis]
MMERLREGVNSIAVKIILGLIILSFVFTGVSGYLGSSNNAAAKVGNTEISRGEFEQAYQNERNRMQSQLGDYFSTLLGDPQYVQSFRKSIIDRMINDILLEQHAQAMGLRISDDQIRAMILEMPQFQSGGAFDQEIYASALRRAGFSPESFAEYLRRDEVRNQLVSALQTSEFSLPSEVAEQGKLIGQTRDIRSLSLNLKTFSEKVSLTDEEVKEYYEQNAAQFTRPEQLKVAYLELSAQELKSQVKVTDEQVQAQYQAHIDQYSTKEQRQVSHILIIGDDEAKAQSVLDELNAGADFVELAKTRSEDPGSSEQGGSLDWIERGVMDPAFEDAAFAIEKAGDVTGLVKSDFGYHIIKLDDLKEPQAQPFEAVAAEIKQELIDTQAVERFYELQTELERVAFEFPDSLDDAAEAIGHKVAHTDFISEVDAPELLLNPVVMQTILDSEVKDTGLNSEVVEVAPEHVIVVRVDDYRDESVLPLEDVKAQATSALASKKGEQQAIELASTLVSELRAGTQTALEANQLSFGDVETIDRGHEFANTVFAMAKPAEGDKVYGQAKDMQGNIVVVELSGVASQIEPAYTAQIGAQLVRTNTQQDLQATLNALRADADIEYYVLDAAQ